MSWKKLRGKINFLFLFLYKTQTATGLHVFLKKKEEEEKSVTEALHSKWLAKIHN